jgi:hypothetical protein
MGRGKLAHEVRSGHAGFVEQARGIVAAPYELEWASGREYGREKGNTGADPCVCWSAAGAWEISGISRV